MRAGNVILLKLAVVQKKIIYLYYPFFACAYNHLCTQTCTQKLFTVPVTRIYKTSYIFQR